MTRRITQAVVIREIVKKNVTLRVGEGIGVSLLNEWAAHNIYHIVESKQIEAIGKLVLGERLRMLTALELLAEQGE